MSEPDQTSEILVQRAKRRDAVAMGALYSRYRDRLHRALARRISGNAGVAGCDSEDLLHDAIVAALEQLEAFEYRGEGSFLAWLLRIAERELLMRLRARSRQKRSPEREVATVSQIEVHASDPTPSQVAIGHEAELLLRRAVERLPAREQEAIVLRRYLELDTAEIAEALELPSAGAARALLARAQARLALLLDAESGR